MTDRFLHKSFYTMFLTAFAGLSLSACGSNQGIVSLTPAITEILFALDAGDQVVGVSNDSDFPATVRTLPRVGDRYKPDVEAIELLTPTLILTTHADNALAERATESGTGFHTITLDTLAALQQSVTLIGGLAGAEGAASQLNARIRKELDAVRARVADKPPVRVLLVTDRAGKELQGIVAAGGNSLVGALAEAAGCENVFAGESRPALEVSQEDIRKAAPDAIIEIRAGKSLTQNQRQDIFNAWKRLDGIPATANSRIYVMNEPHALRPGPRVAEIATAIADNLHGQVIPE